LIIKFLVNTKNTEEGKVLSGWTVWQLASVALQNLSFAGSYALLVVERLFFKRDLLHRDTVYTECTRINYIIVPVTNLNKYWHYTSGTE
jgi:hypothetical protein